MFFFLIFYKTTNITYISHKIEKYWKKSIFILIINVDFQTFLLTNSAFHFVDQGMKYLLSEGEQPQEWRDLFDVIITSASKPLFYKRFIFCMFFGVMFSDRPFRLVDTNTGSIKWEQVGELKPGEVYVDGSLKVRKKLWWWY